MGGRWSAPRSGRFTPGKDPVHTVQEAGWAPRAGPDGCGKSRLPPSLLPSRMSLYRLSYRGPQQCGVLPGGISWTWINSLYSSSWLVFTTGTDSVYCAVRVGSINVIQINLCLQMLTTSRLAAVQNTNVSPAHRPFHPTDINIYVRRCISALCLSPLNSSFP